MDRELIRRAQGGDREAFTELALAIGDRLHAIAFRVLRDADLAEDATQQALLSIWQDLPQLRDPEAFDAWSYRLLVRACYAEGRRSRRDIPGLRLLHAPEPRTVDAAGAIADRDQLERAFRRLSMGHRAVVVLHHYLGLQLEEVAAALDIPIGTVRSRLFYAMRGLRAAIADDQLPHASEAIR